MRATGERAKGTRVWVRLARGLLALFFLVFQAFLFMLWPVFLPVGWLICKADGDPYAFREYLDPSGEGPLWVGWDMARLAWRGDL